MSPNGDNEGKSDLEINSHVVAMTVSDEQVRLFLPLMNQFVCE